MSDKISFLKESFVFELYPRSSYIQDRVISKIDLYPRSSYMLYPRSSYIQDAATGGCLRINIFAMCIFNYFTDKMYVIMLVEPVQCWKN